MRLNRFALTEIRERSGYSKSAFARDAEISTGTLSDLESGRRNPSPEVVKRMAEVLKIPIPAILLDPNEADAAPAARQQAAVAASRLAPARRSTAVLPADRTARAS